MQVTFQSLCLKPHMCEWSECFAFFLCLFSLLLPLWLLARKRRRRRRRMGRPIAGNGENEEEKSPPSDLPHWASYAVFFFLCILPWTPDGTLFFLFVRITPKPIPFSHSPNSHFCSLRSQRWCAKWKPICKAQSVLINKISASELSRKFIKSALMVGKKRRCETWWSFISLSTSLDQEKMEKCLFPTNSAPLTDSN